MTDKELLKQKLEDAKSKLEEKGYFLGEEGELMDLFPSMKQYEYAFQDAIEEVWPDKAWWQLTNYWDIFQESIMSGKSADEVIQDILDHIDIDEETPEVEWDDDFDIDDDEEVQEELKTVKIPREVTKTVYDKKQVDRNYYIQNVDDGRYIKDPYHIDFCDDIKEAKKYQTKEKAKTSIESMKKYDEWKWFGRGNTPKLKVIYVDEEINESLTEAPNEVKVSDSVFELVKDLDEGE